MDNDIKIKTNEQRHKDVLLFLQEELEPLKLRNSASSYNLEKEYEKTKKNKSFYVPVLLISSLLVVVLLSLIMTKTIEKADKDIRVNVEEFDDVNLKNLIDTVARTQDQYENAVKNKVQIERQMNSELNAALDKREGDIVTVQSLNLRNKKDEAARIDAIKKTYEDTVKQIRGNYAEQLDAADSEIAEYKQKLDEYDATKLAAAQEQQRALDSQRQLQELEKKKMVDSYENKIQALERNLSETRRKHKDEMKKSLSEVSDKLQSEIDALDPEIKDEYADTLLASPALNARLELDPVNHQVFGEGNISDGNLKGRLDEIKAMYEDYKYLDKSVLEIPHKNQIGQYVSANAYMVDKVTNDLADTVYNQYIEKVSLRHEMEQLKQDHQAEVAKLNKEIAALEEAKYDVLYESMQGAGISCVISEKPVSKEEIYVLIRPDARFLLGENAEEGCDAEIPFKKVIKGRVEKVEDGRFRFIPEMKNGKYVDFDLEALKMGIQVKLK